MKKDKLKAIAEKYSTIEYNKYNYHVGGGVVGYKYASMRHENAVEDPGKLTLGQATQLFKKATQLSTELVRNIIKHTFPDMEWHHAGSLPKRYGGGMKKTYFLNSQQIVELATNWNTYYQPYNLTIYYTGYAFENEKLYQQYLDLKR